MINNKDDVKFYFDKRESYQKDRKEEKIINGGNKNYNDKYIKYKSKYLQLK